MKVLIINECDVDGGAEIQTKREYDMWKKRGDTPYCIFIKKKGDIYNDKNVFFYRKNIGRIRTLFGKIFFDKNLYRFIKNNIEEIKPDIVHINNIFYSPYAVYKAIGERKCIQTLRDYKVVCPKSTKCLSNWKVCNKSYGKYCIKCIIFSSGMVKKIKELAEYIFFPKVDYYRRKYVDKFIAPSNMLKEYCAREGMDIICIANAFEFSYFSNFKKNITEPKIFMFYGAIAEHKGIVQLVEAFLDFSVDKDVELHIVGKCDKKIGYWLEKIKNKKIRIFGHMGQEDIIKKLQSVYSIVVPSLWIENYPNTVLEGFATQCVVLASNRGGMVEQIDNPGCIFDVLNKQDIIKKLEYALYLSEYERKEILEKQIKYLQLHNDIDVYYNSLMECIKCVV